MHCRTALHVCCNHWIISTLYVVCLGIPTDQMGLTLTLTLLLGSCRVITSHLSQDVCHLHGFRLSMGFGTCKLVRLSASPKSFLSVCPDHWWNTGPCDSWLLLYLLCCWCCWCSMWRPCYWWGDNNEPHLSLLYTTYTSDYMWWKVSSDPATHAL